MIWMFSLADFIIVEPITFTYSTDGRGTKLRHPVSLGIGNTIHFNRKLLRNFRLSLDCESNNNLFGDWGGTQSTVTADLRGYGALSLKNTEIVSNPNETLSREQDCSHLFILNTASYCCRKLDSHNQSLYKTIWKVLFLN